MIQHDPLWEDINTLLSHLHSFEVIKLVQDKYDLYGNRAPADLLRLEIEDLQKRLNAAPHKI